MARAQNTDKFEEDLRFRMLRSDSKDRAERREAFQGESLAYPFEDTSEGPPLPDVDVSGDEVVGPDEACRLSDLELMDQLPR